VAILKFWDWEIEKLQISFPNHFTSFTINYW